MIFMPVSVERSAVTPSRSRVMGLGYRRRARPGMGKRTASDFFPAVERQYQDILRWTPLNVRM